MSERDIECVVVVGQGIARPIDRVTRKGIEYVVYQLVPAGAKLHIPVASLAEAIRPLMSRAQATQLSAQLRGPSMGADTRSVNVRFQAQQRAQLSGSLPDLVRELHQLYSNPWSPTFGERRRIEMLAGLVLPELAWVLGDGAPTHDELASKRKITGQRPADWSTIRPTLTSPAPSFSAEYLGSMENESGLLLLGKLGRLTAGKAPSLDEVSDGTGHLAKARRGTWEVFFRPPSSPLQLMAVHRDHLNHVGALEASAPSLCHLDDVSSFFLHIVDVAVCGEPGYSGFMLDAVTPLFSEGVLRTRSAWFSGRLAPGEGSYFVYGATENDELVFAALGEERPEAVERRNREARSRPDPFGRW